MKDSANELVIFCNNIRYLRQINNLSKVEMCKIMHLTIVSLNKLENNIIPNRMSAIAIDSMCEYFKISMLDLFTVNFEKRN